MKATPATPAQKPLPQRVLGKTNIKLSLLGLGTVKFGRNQGLKYPHSFELPTDQQIRELLACAHDHGINLLDTAPAYGHSEQRLGKALAKQRDRWVICTKAGESWAPSDSGGSSVYNFSPESIMQSVADSRERLNTDYLDIVLLHSNGEDEKIIRMGALDTLAELKDKGWLRAFGMSSKTSIGGCLAAERSDVVMLSYRPDYLDEAPVLEHCAQHGSGAIIKKVFASGHQTKASDNLHFALSHPATTSVLVSTVNLEHLCENIGALSDLD
jgi:aryl-alcohol dehydrogenase-like predicted oxidoreductase